MKRAIILLAAMLSLCLLMAAPAFAAASDLVSDGAGVLTESECRELNDLALDIAGKYKCEVVVYVVKDMGGGEAFDNAMKAYKDNGYGYGEGRDGMMFFLSEADRDYSLISFGYGSEALTEHGKDVMLDNYVLPLLKNDNYYEAFLTYLNKSAEYLELAAAGAPFDTDTDEDYLQSQASARAAGNLFVVFVIPVLVALIVCLVFRRQMKTAKAQRAAQHYIPSGGFVLTGSSDTYMYSTESRTTINDDSDNSGHSSSGGFSGRSGKY